MPFSAEAVANFFLDAHPATLTPMKLQKLVYYAHGWHLALTGDPLINEPVQAWRHGPVIQSLYREFSEFGDQPITRNAIDLRVRSGVNAMDSIEEYEPRLEAEGDEEEVAYARELLCRVWDEYGKYSATQLSNLTHKDGSPWSIVSKKYRGAIPRGLRIPNELILDRFRSEMEQAEQQH